MGGTHVLNKKKRVVVKVSANESKQCRKNVVLEDNTKYLTHNNDD